MTIEAKVKKIISEKIPGIDIEDISPEASLIEDLGADSLTLVELIMSLEDIFDIEIDDTDAEKIVTVQDAINFIRSKI
jgi:acyl carrier protein